jgi:hypothetical protein
MVAEIGKSADPSTATRRDDASGSEPASFRYNNPGAQYPSERAARFGQTGYGIIGGGHKIARFPSPVNGAAANFDLLSRNYVGMQMGAAGKKWTGSYGFGIPGYSNDMILTKEMLDDPKHAIAILKAIAGRESGHGNNLSEDQWQQAHQMFTAGSANAFLAGGRPKDEELMKEGTPGGAVGPTGAGLLRRAREHIREEYVNRLVPKDDPNWKGPWDCAEFMSWLVYGPVSFMAVSTTTPSLLKLTRTLAHGKKMSSDSASVFRSIRRQPRSAASSFDIHRHRARWDISRSVTATAEPLKRRERNSASSPIRFMAGDGIRAFSSLT